MVVLESVKEKPEKSKYIQEIENYNENPEILSGIVESKGDFSEEARTLFLDRSFDYFFVRTNSGTDSARTVMVNSYKSWNLDSLINIEDTLEISLDIGQRDKKDIIVYPLEWDYQKLKINGKEFHKKELTHNTSYKN